MRVRRHRSDGDYLYSLLSGGGSGIYIIVSVPVHMNRQAMSLYVRKKLCVTDALKKCLGFPSIYQVHILGTVERKFLAPNSFPYTTENYFYLESGQAKQNRGVHSQEAKRCGERNAGAELLVLGYLAWDLNPQMLPSIFTVGLPS